MVKGVAAPSGHPVFFAATPPDLSFRGLLLQAVDAALKGALVELVQEPRAVGEVFNVGNDQEISIRALAERVKTVAHSASDIVTLPYDQVYEAGFEDMARRIPDLSKIRTLIGYEPTVQLDRIIEEVVEFTRQRPPSA